MNKVRASLAGPLDRWSSILPSSSSQETDEIVEDKQQALESFVSSSTSSVESKSSSEWLENQKPPMSPMFTKASLDDLTASAADAPIKYHPEKPRSFQVE
ncbi:hypothetical protein FB639_006478, partial [Coemansia asiatica]